MSDRHILTAVAWPYANGPRHIGHVSGFGVPSDVFSRYHRMVGDRVLMVSGTDEHGTPILVQAEAERVTPRELVDRNNRVIVEDLVALGDRREQGPLLLHSPLLRPDQEQVEDDKDEDPGKDPDQDGGTTRRSAGRGRGGENQMAVDHGFKRLFSKKE